MNQSTLAGHLGADPEVRFTSTGQKVTTLRLAAKARRGSKDKGDDTIWWRVTVWGEQFDKMIVHLKKGSAIMVFGEISKPEIFTDKEGKPQISMNITAHHIAFSPFGKPEASSHGSSEGFGSSQESPAYAAMGGESAFGQGKAPAAASFSDDEIPF